MKKSLSFIFILCALFSVSISYAAPKEELRTVDFVDLNKYMGHWHEIASIPQNFQKQCVSDVTAQYTPQSDQSVKVLNSCLTENGARDSAEGRAIVVDKETNAKLRVSFFKLFKWIYTFGGDYWIIQLPEDYRYAVVGHPDRTYGWVLAREPFLPHSDLQEIEAKLKTQGYDTCTLLTTNQSGGISDRIPLCDYVL